MLAITQLTEVLSKETTEESKKRIEEKSDSSPAETSSLGTEVEGGQKKTEKRGLYGSYGDLGSSSSYGGGWESQDHDYHVKTVTIEKKVPVPYPGKFYPPNKFNIFNSLNIALLNTIILLLF